MEETKNLGHGSFQTEIVFTLAANIVFEPFRLQCLLLVPIKLFTSYWSMFPIIGAAFGPGAGVETLYGILEHSSRIIS